MKACGGGDGKSVVYVHRDSDLRSRLLSSGEERVLHKGAGLHHLVASPDGKAVPVASGDGSILLLGDEARSIPFRGATAQPNWRIPIGLLRERRGTVAHSSGWIGSGFPLETPGNRKPGFSVHPDGNRIALTVSNARSEVRALQLTNEP